jgi:hypothetical protein
MKPITRTATIGPTYFWGLFMFAAFALLALFYFRFGVRVESYEEQRAKARIEKLAALQKEEQEKLGGYKLLDPAKGTVQLPIQHAMQLVVGELKAKAPRPSEVKVEVPYPAGLAQPQTAGAATAPAPGKPEPATGPAPATPPPAPGPNQPATTPPVPGAEPAAPAPVPAAPSTPGQPLPGSTPAAPLPEPQ